MPSTHSVLRDRWYREGWFSGQTLLDAFAAGAQVHGHTPVTFVGGDFDASLTVAEIRRDALNLAAKLQRLGIGPGDAVAVQVTNRPECPAIYQGVLLCGAVLVPIVHIYGTAEVRFILTESAAKVIVMPERWRTTRYHERVQELSEIDTLGQIVLLDAGSGAGYRTFSELPGCAEDYQPPAVCSDEVCLVLYTSGTTSAPKGVQHTHNTVLAEQRTMPALFATTDDTTLVTFPPGHIAGVGAVLRPLLSGARTVFLDSWDPKLASDIVQRFAVTNTAGAPFHLEGILACGDIAHKLATLDEFLVGAAPVSEDLLRRAAAAGITTFRSYGATEHPTVTGEHLGASRLALLSTDGRPMPGSAVRIVGPGGADCACGVDGEVLVQGPEQFVGYQDGALNAVAFTADGWFRTGDLGHLDIDGRLVITDRIKDVIIRGGETISSAQVEEVLYAHPAVCECAVVAAPHPRYGDVVAAVVVLHHGRALDLDEVRAHFALSGLARQKTPEHLVVVDALPRTPLGKVRKADLRDEHFSW